MRLPPNSGGSPSDNHVGLTADHLKQLDESTLFRNLHELHLQKEASLGNDGIRLIASSLPLGLQDLTCSNTGVLADGFEALTHADQLRSLKTTPQLKRRTRPRPDGVKLLSASRNLSGVRSLILNRCRLGEKSIRHLTRSKFWQNLVELDLRDNPINLTGFRYLMDAPVPPDLTALVLNEDRMGQEVRIGLKKKFGERLVSTRKLE